MKICATTTDNSGERPGGAAVAAARRSDNEPGAAGSLRRALPRLLADCRLRRTCLACQARRFHCRLAWAREMLAKERAKWTKDPPRRLALYI